MSQFFIKFQLNQDFNDQNIDKKLFSINSEEKHSLGLALERDLYIGISCLLSLFLINFVL